MNVIVVGPDVLDRLAELPLNRRATVYGYYRQWWAELVYFHRDGHTYTVLTVRPPRPLGALSRALSTTFYNPTLGFAIEYARGSRYTSDDLRSAIAKAIERDDDIITQFREPEELLALAAAAQSFDDFLDLVAFAATPED